MTSKNANLSMLMAALMVGSAGLPIDDDTPCQIGSPRRPKIPKPKVENPELQLAAEEKRRRRLERNRRNLK